jgi:hypothetical protein
MMVLPSPINVQGGCLSDSNATNSNKVISAGGRSVQGVYQTVDRTQYLSEDFEDAITPGIVVRSLRI